MTPEQAQRWLAPWQPTRSDPWDQHKVTHLLRRAAFGGTPALRRRCLRRGYHGTLRWLLRPGSDEQRFLSLLRQVAGDLVDLSNVADLRAWWLFRMLHSPYPLAEKMTLFWHGHFATSVAKVRRVELLYDQNQTLRRHGLGGMRNLLRAISRDPAMLIWLDNRYNRKGKPNENYARELLELFTMGIGHYTESDVKNAARAFTGWHLRNGKFFYNRRAHDYGAKTFMGRRGAFGGDDIIDIILEQPATSHWIARKLLTFFLYPAPEPALVEALAFRLRDSNYHLRSVMEVLLRSRIFYSPKAYKRLIKSPVELAIGAVQALEGRVSTRALGAEIARMGQGLFAPPNVKGWDGDEAWINPTRMLARWNGAMALTAARGGRFGSHIRPGITARRLGHRTAEDVTDYYLEMLLDGDVTKDVRRRLLGYLELWDGGRHRAFRLDRRTINAKVRGLIHLCLSLPEYQLN